jgi:hypothetical protein
MVLDDSDRALKTACGFEGDDIVSDEKFADRASVFLGNYQQ